MRGKRRRLLFVSMALVVALGLVAGGRVALNHFGGRTPSAGFVGTVFPDDQVVFDRTYDSEGSSEDKTRTVVLRTKRTPDQVVSALIAHGGWSRLGTGVLRESDGLCVVPWTPAQYQQTHDDRGAHVSRTVGSQPAIILSMLYC